MKLKLLSLSLFFLPLLCLGQKDALAPTLVSSSGGYNLVGGVSLSYSVGEPVVNTLQTPALPNPADFYLTQGFQQPQTSRTALGMNLFYSNESCLNSKDGSAYITISGGVPPYTVTWSSNPTYNNLSIDSLTPGPYTVTLTDGNGLTSTQSFIVQASESACEVKIYNGITPNGDGQNDTWIIGNIEAYPDNSVSIYNRWGIEVWSVNGYDNSKNVWFGQNQQGQPLPDGTYFYVVKIKDASPMKGWVQVTR